jgi:competence protein ComEA
LTPPCSPPYTRRAEEWCNPTIEERLVNRWPALKPYLAGTIVALAIVVSVLLLRGRGPGEPLIVIEPLPDGQTLTVFVGGAVARPGVYTLQRGDRVDSAIAAAGGFSEEADPDGLNRALKLRDEAQVIVPRKGAPRPTATREGVAAAGNTTPATVSAGGGGSQSLAATNPGRVNVNSAAATELERLPGVGPRLAQSIIDYRAANGPFAGPADLAKVRGISERMVESWAELITFGP